MLTPAMILRLRQADDEATATILELILREEIAHVAAGSRWFLWCCEREGREPQRTFAELLQSVRAALRAPFNLDARRAAGFGDVEMAQLQALASGRA
jgi:uncharacterized ferritin-like protein (DUF455 family)